MRLLILSCNTGEGHNSAARAIKEYFAAQNISCDIKDALAFWSPEKSKIISKGHVFIYRKLPKLFGVSYRFEQNHPPRDGEESFIYELVIRGCESLYKFLGENDYNAIICTHVFSSMMVTELIKRHKCKIKSYFIATDYTSSPGVSQTALDKYFIPHKKLTEEFAADGIPAAKLIPSGIPVRGDFYLRTEKIAAKAALNLPADKRIVLLMCGSMGCGPIKTLAETLPKLMPEDVQLTVICGNNRRLYKSLTKNPLHKNVQVIGFTDKMPLYMDAAELILTKPGGLSTTEAAVKALPMVFIDAVPGCETKNFEFFTSHGYADSGKTVTELCEKVCDYLENPEKLQKISARLNEDFSVCAAQNICDYILNEVSFIYGKL